MLGNTRQRPIELERLRMEIQLNIGDVNGAVTSLKDMVIRRDSTEAAKVLMDYLIHHGRSEEAEEICGHAVARIDEHVARTTDAERRRALGAGLRYFLDRSLKFATINRRSPEVIEGLKIRLKPFAAETKEDHLSTIRNPGFLDPQDVRKPRWHVDEDVNYYPEYFSRSINFGEAIREFILAKHPRKSVTVGPDDEILTYGSCFASNLRQGLKKRGYPAQNIDIPEGLNNSFALLNYFKWAISGESLGEAAYDSSTLGGGREMGGRRGS
jgi:hypothetical protein